VTEYQAKHGVRSAAGAVSFGSGCTPTSIFSIQLGTTIELLETSRNRNNDRTFMLKPTCSLYFPGPTAISISGRRPARPAAADAEILDPVRWGKPLGDIDAALFPQVLGDPTG